MSENLETEKIEIIKEAFEEKREIIGFAPQEMTCIDNQDPIEDVFITRSGELIDLELQIHGCIGLCLIATTGEYTGQCERA